MQMVLNAALGFDTYLVMRHGARTPSPETGKNNGPERLGCYYCNDIVAPADVGSLSLSVTFFRFGIRLLILMLVVWMGGSGRAGYVHGRGGACVLFGKWDLHRIGCALGE